MKLRLLEGEAQELFVYKMNLEHIHFSIYFLCKSLSLLFLLSQFCHFISFQHHHWSHFLQFSACRTTWMR